MVLLCNKWSTLSSPTGSLNVLSRKCNRTALSPFQSSPRRRKNYPYSPLLLHRQERAAKWKHFFFPWKSSGRSSSSFPWYQGHFFYKTLQYQHRMSVHCPRAEQGPWPAAAVVSPQIRSLAGSRSDTPINWDVWVEGSWETCGGVEWMRL